MERLGGVRRRHLLTRTVLVLPLARNSPFTVLLAYTTRRAVIPISAAFSTSGDPYNPHFRPGASSTTNASTPGWSSSGTLAKNSTVFLVLLTFSALLSPLTFWTTMPESTYAAADNGTGGSAMSLGYDRRHWDAVRNLEKARREAKDGGTAKREAIRSVGNPRGMDEDDVC